MTYEETFDQLGNSVLRNRVAVACWYEGKAIFLEAPEVPERIIWAVNIFRDNGTGTKINEVFKAILVVLTNPETATDEQIQTAVGQVVNKFAMAGV